MEILDFNHGWVLARQGADERKDITLPHDAMIHEPRNAGNPSGAAGAYFPGGVYIYEKTFAAPVEWANKSVWFEFEGVYQNAKVSINGNEAGGKPYGYIPFVMEANQYLQYGQENTIRVVADNAKQPNSRWYTGSGIYRPVWLHVADKLHIQHEGVRISTLSYAPARIRVDVAHNAGKNARVVVEILDGNTLMAQGDGETVELDIPDAKLWSEETPHLYQCKASLLVDGVAVDTVTETFGIRLVEWGEKGLFVNGKNTLLRGGCVHHDNGILGACSYAKSEERRVRILKQAGYNAIRSSHNPASKAMLAACDKLGVYIMDETWDMWYFHKNKDDYATHFEANYKNDIEALVARDFNHPSVIMYSIGNEISEPYQPKGIQLTKEMVALIHSLDPNRAVTCGVNLMVIKSAAKGKGIYKEEGGMAKQEKQKATSSTMFNMMAAVVGPGMNKAANGKFADEVTKPCLDALDIAGYNYTSGRYVKEAKENPGRIICGTETFPQDIAKNWALVKQLPYLIGDFMWTSWDYLGEVGLGAWAYTDDAAAFNKPYPWLLADCGAIDIVGNIGAEAAYAATVWGLRKAPYLGVRPVNHPGRKPTKMVWRGTNAMNSWAWQGCEGNRAEIEIYSDAHTIELLLNGKPVGKKRLKAFKSSFKMNYLPGCLEAVAYDAAGQEVGRSKLNSAAGKLSINATPEEATVQAGEIVYIPIALVGENGVTESNADAKLSVTVDGGELLAFGSANPRTEERFDAGTYTTYYGRAQAVVRCAKPGKLTFHVTGESLQEATASITITE